MKCPHILKAREKSMKIKKNNSLIEQQNRNKVDNPEYLDSTEENVMNTSEN